MLLENTTVGVIGFGLKAKGSKPILAIPGINRIEGKHWHELSKNPSVIHMIEKTKKLVVVVAKEGNKKKAEEFGCHPDFAEMEQEDAVQIVKKCLFLPLLKDWLDEESRPKMQRVLHEQIDLAGPTAVKKSEA